MKKLASILLFFPLAVSAQFVEADKFITFLNNYKIDSLESMLTEDFVLTRTFVKYSNDKKSFLEEYVPNSKNCNARFLIIKPLKTGNPIQLLAEDRSDYLKYLDIRPVLWRLTIAVNNGKIASMAIDTIAGVSKEYFVMIEKKMKMFEDWLDREYPGERNDRIYEEPGLLTKRLSEFAKFEDSH